MNKILATVLAVALFATACAAPPTPPAPEAPKAETNTADAPTADAPADDSTAQAPAAVAKEDIKVGFVFIGTVGDEGYTFAHNQGRLAMEAATGVKSVFVENVPENADCQKVMRDLIDQGCNIIIGNSFGFGEFMYEVAPEYPDVKFMHCSGYWTADNMSAFFGRIYQMRYLSGIVAGMKTEGKIGYVAAMPIPEVVRGIDAFTLGVRSVNPTATVEVVWTNTWYDPAVEKSAAIELLNKGCDVIAQHQDTTAPQIAAGEKGKYAIGYNSSTPNAAPNAYLTAPIWNWGTYYTREVQKIIDGTWQPTSYWGGFEDDIVALDTLSANCAEGTQAKVDEAQAKLKAGELPIFIGPLMDNEGNEKVAQGVVLTDDELLSLDWFVEGVVGSVPKN